VGNWKRNKMHGKGILTLPNGNVCYDGEFSYDKFHGKGILFN
jgi:hypothetical protein